ncbi:Transposase (plasmid) [Shigella dysenteriae 1617]|uniref:Transposase n=1 Tax=Shigella dysenteriae 1617 TaxID=754093 RepID=A0A0A7A5C0_SHIDY|nr:Transposase [Shigella dysenteriae 1617]
MKTVQTSCWERWNAASANDLPSSPVEWLTDNGSCYRANETRQFARMLGLEPKNTAVRSPESNGIAESFVKTIKRDYIQYHAQTRRVNGSKEPCRGVRAL